MDASRRCYNCTLLLPRADFSFSSRNADGILHICRVCSAAHRKAQRQKNPEKHNAQKRAWRQTEKGKDLLKRCDDNRKRRSAERRKAAYMMADAIEAGRLIRQPCEVCGAVKTDGHHDDYSKPLSVRWLCRKHHAQHHHGKEPVRPVPMIPKGQPIGVRNGEAKLKDAEVLAIRAAYTKGRPNTPSDNSLAGLARIYGLCPQTVHSIVRRKTWRHI